MERGLIGVALAQKDGLGDLQHQPFGWQPRISQRSYNRLYQIAALELDWREIYGHFERERPSHRFCASLAQDPFAQRDDEADLRGQWNEVGRQNHAALGMMPMQQSLEATDVATLQIDHRLIVEFELVLAEGFTELELEYAAQLDAPIHFWFEKVKAPAAIRLGTVQCHVCVAQ